MASEQGVVLDTDPTTARAAARAHLATYLALPNYSNNWMRLGFTPTTSSTAAATGSSTRSWCGATRPRSRPASRSTATPAPATCASRCSAAPRSTSRWSSGAPSPRAHVRDVRLRPLPALRRADGLAARSSPPTTPTSSPSSRTATATRAATCGSSPSPTRRPEPHDTKPAHWVDASIHAVELTATVAACYLLQHLVDGHAVGDPVVAEALRDAHVLRRAPRQPRRRRVGAGRPAPVPPVEHPAVAVGRRPPLARASTSRTSTATGASCRCASSTPTARGWPTPTTPACSCPSRRRAAARCRPLPPARRGRRSSTTTASRSRRPARPRGSTSTATSRPAGAPACAGPATTRCRSRRSTPSSGPSSPAPTSAATTRSTPAAACCCARRRRDPTRPCRRVDVWTWKQLGEIGTALTGYPVHSVYEDFTWDKSDTMSGAADDWAYEHLGVYSWTTEFWDVVARRHRHASSRRTSGTLGPTDEQALAVLRWVRRARARASSSTGTRSSTPSSAPSSSVAGTTSGCGRTRRSTCSRAEVTPHAVFAVSQAMASPRLEIRHQRAVDLGGGTWRIEVGIANTGWLPTPMSVRARPQRPGAPDRGRGHRRGRRRRRWAGPPAARPARGPRHDAVHVRPRRHARPPPGRPGSCRRRPGRRSR